MSTSQPRRAKTTAASTAGSFAEKPQSAPEADLDVQPRFREVAVKLSWEKYGLPPRHKTPRDYFEEQEVTVAIRDLTGDEAPIGVTTGEGDRRVEYRCHDGRLYVPAPTDDFSREPSRHRQVRQAEAFQQRVGVEVARIENEYVYIDGELWMSTPEPVYWTQTFGIGHNHGGTSLSTRTAYPEVDGHALDGVFPADQFEEAKAHAIAVALKRGDTDSVERIKNEKPSIEFTDAFTPGTTYRQAPKLQYTDMHTAKYGAEHLPEAEVQERISRARQEMQAQILATPGLVIVERREDGTVRRRIDRTALSHKQAQDWEAFVSETAFDL